MYMYDTNKIAPQGCFCEIATYSVHHCMTEIWLWYQNATYNVYKRTYWCFGTSILKTPCDA